MSTRDDNLSALTVPVAGMTCRACEVRVAKALSSLPGVEHTEVSAARGRATLFAASLPDRADVDEAIRQAGYAPQAPSWVSGDPRVWTTAGLAALAVLALSLVLAQLDLGARLDASASGGGVAVALLVGLVAGFSTCMALVGGLVVALTASYGARYPARVATWRGRVGPQAAFNGGRLVGFALGGAALGLVGSTFELPTTVLALAVLVASVVMTILGVRLAGLSPRMAAWSPTLPGRWGRRLAGGPGDDGGYTDARAAAAGAASFLLPCGFTQAMQIYAVSTGSPTQAAAVMLAFALGTTPGLLGLGVAAGTASARGGVLAMRAVGVVVLAFALVNLTGGLRSLGVALPWDATGAGSLTVSDNVTLSGDTQTVTMAQTADGYLPAHITVYAGVPIRWVIDSPGPFSCAAFLRVPSLDVQADLQPGANTVRLPGLKEGRTPFTCVMGMYDGSFTAIPRLSAPQGG